MSTVRLLEVARAELAEAVAWYNEQSPGLGFDLANEVREALHKLETFPSAWPVFSRRTRRCMVRRFPYGVLYQLRDDEVLILAIMHFGRDPEYWQKRCK